jgi:lysophospholipase L1-like esterase
MGRKRRLSVGKNWQIAGLALLAVLALGVAGYSVLKPAASKPEAAFTPAPITAPTTPAPAKIVSVLSDSHANNADSWWRQTAAAGKVPGLALGAFESQPGAMSTSLAARLDAATAKKGLVIVQAGTNDLLALKTPAQAAAGVQALWQGIKDRGATPVAALVPPSDKAPDGVVQLNDLLARAAAAQGLKVIDVYHAVANPDGTWAAGTTADGTHANKAGSDRMATAASEQLPELTK